MPDPTAPHTDVALQHRLGTLQLDLAFRTAAPWTVLFGPSGSGKSTILRAVAGLLRPQHGSITLHGAPVFHAVARLFIPPHLRAVRWAGQRTALFPHRTVLGNILLGTPADAGRERLALAQQVVDHFALQPLAPKLPAQLSGGEQQRVAIARAAAGARGTLLLLDEPFSGLDTSIRDQLIDQLRTWLGPTPVLSVTHDVSEAFLLHAEVLRLGEGRILAQGPAASILAPERQRLLATL